MSEDCLDNQAIRNKKNRERAKKEQQKEKDLKRAMKKEEKKNRTQNGETGEDPDLAGMVPGPQPRDDD